MEKKKIYLASPFFNELELVVYKETIHRLREAGYEVYVPQEHTIPHAWSYSNKEWAKMVFDEDVWAIQQSDVVMVLNFGMYSDSGTAWEAGFAAALNKEIVQVLCGYENATYSLMMMNACSKVVRAEWVGCWEEKASVVELDTIIQK